jgi:prepilin-type N-terminal cleavage/methylation domain-containing protein
MDRHAARGMTLMEVTVVMALSALVVMGMISFYISSQSTWLAGSTQALAQRDATLLIEAVSDSVRAAASAEVRDDVPDPLHQCLILRDAGRNQFWCFWWDGGDSLVHQGPDLGHDRGPVVASRVTRFQVDADSSLVQLRLVELHASDGQLVRMTSAAALYNRRSQTP